MNNVVQTKEKDGLVFNGWLMLPLTLLVFLGSIVVFITAVNLMESYNFKLLGITLVIGSVLVFVTDIILLLGFFTLQPNEARVLILFGEYKGTVRMHGFHWGNPFYANGPCGVNLKASGEGADVTTTTHKAKSNAKAYSRYKISLRTRNMNGDVLKVNDKRGNPIEIAAVIVWKVQDTAQALFDVEDYESYVRIQSESAVRHVASAYAYDHGEENEATLRSNVEEVSQGLKVELQERLSRAGVVVEEARLTHLAYAPEIAGLMLRRQQAEAVIAARQKIVHGAVSMVEMALTELANKHIVDLDTERKAAMVSNLMVVLCSESEVHPVVNAGTLYT